MAHKIFDPATQEARIFHEADCDLKRLKGKTVAVIGFGSQGHAHALNLKDSGVNVIIGLNKGGRTWPIAEEAGFAVYPVKEAEEKAEKEYNEFNKHQKITSDFDKLLLETKKLNEKKCGYIL